MDSIKKVWNWLVYSSKDPKKVSLMIRGLGVGLLTWVGFSIGLLHYTLPTEQVNNLIDAITVAVQSVLAVVAALSSAYTAIAVVVGTARKLYTTVMGTNQVINPQE